MICSRSGPPATGAGSRSSNASSREPPPMRRIPPCVARDVPVPWSLAYLADGAVRGAHWLLLVVVLLPSRNGASGDHIMVMRHPTPRSPSSPTDQLEVLELISTLPLCPAQHFQHRQRSGVTFSPLIHVMIAGIKYRHTPSRRLMAPSMTFVYSPKTWPLSAAGTMASWT
jgi:hypothetical protein